MFWKRGVKWCRLIIGQPWSFLVEHLVLKSDTLLTAQGAYRSTGSCRSLVSQQVLKEGKIMYGMRVDVLRLVHQ